MKILKKRKSLSRSYGMKRREFLSYIAATAAIPIITTACDKNDDNGGIDLGSGDVGILNYAYALEQLEAAFYTQVILTPYSSMPSEELALLTDIRDHEIAHSEFLQKVLSTYAIPALQVNFSSINFGNRQSVLLTAKTFEDLGVSAYNGAGKLITSGDYLLIAGKIVSVEARHAAYIRDLISYGSFADDMVIDSNGLDNALSPNDVLAAVSPFLVSKLNASQLPTS